MRIAALVRTRLTSLLAVGSMVVAGLAVTALTAPAASADLSPIADAAASTVSADALPTVQIDGVVWDQAIVGNTVYVAGQFNNARPAGAAAGTNLTPRGNLLAYNLTTGALITTFAPALNAQAKVVAASPDGSRIYVGGTFTTANGSNRYRLAAYSTATGALITTFAPTINAGVSAIVATNTTVYVGGTFASAGGQPRSRLAAFNASNGAVTTWAPIADGNVNAMTMSPDGAIIAGGAFQNVNASAAYGLAKLDPAMGALLPWNTTNLIRDAGPQAAILSLSTSGTDIIGSGYVFGAGGNLEGTFSADAVTGNINWVEDCHGDTYDSYSSGTAVYTVSHAHYCGNLGGFFQSNPWAINMRHALAFTATATGTLGHDPYGYYDFYGTPSPSLINWFPNLAVGSFTGKTQAAWSVTGNGQYVVMGGEFPTVNGVAQQGLVRFALPSIAPNKVGPNFKAGQINPSVIGLPSGAARVAWQANWDMDNHTLTYTLTRNGVQIYQADADSTFWSRPTMGYIDSTLTAGTLYKYRLSVNDSDGNIVQSENVNFTASAAGSTNAYAQRVVADGASPYWPMNETTGTVLFDNAGFTDADTSAAVTRGVLPGAVSTDAATTFNGSTSAGTRTAIPGPNTYTAQAWIKTTSTSGGKILGFGNASSGNSSGYDRHVYMDGAGHIWFGVYPNGVATLNSTGTYNDGQWHQITTTLGPDGMRLYIDAKLIAQRGDVTVGQDYQGYWRVGGDNLGGWPGDRTSDYFAGSIDEVAIYPTVLTRQAINAQWIASGRASTIPSAPSDSYGAAVFNDNPLLFWRLGESSGTIAADSSQNGDQTGTYLNNVVLGQPGGIKGTTNTAAGFDGIDDQVTSANSYSNPMNYSEEAWFKTTTTNGGKIVGFGCAQNGLSGCYDRHIYMNNDGKVTFGVYNGNLNTITTATALNDGKWHQVAASQSNVDGMKFYVDGALVGTNGTTNAQDYTGYWKVGGDNHWGCCSPYLNATIDDVSIYGSVLSASQIANHFNLGNTVVAPNQAPVAAFTSTATYLDAAFTSTSTDADGTISSYAWNFGDGGTSTQANPTHSYATANTYTVSLTVTDNVGATNVVTHPVIATTPPANQAPTASFSVITDQLTANVNGSTSSDPDGTIVGYAWDFHDGGTATGVTASHAYTTAGMKTVTLTVTDNQGASNSSTQPVQVTAPPPNTPPTASFGFTVNGLTANAESTSTDVDGTIVSYAWTYGDGGTGNTSAVVHTFGAAGTYPVTLTVTDNGGASTSITQSVTVTTPPPANVPPTAAFTVTTAGLTASVNGSSSSDSDGTIAGYSWNFGDGSTDLVTTPSADHPFASAGTYQVALTVTDNLGATNTVTKPVTVSTATPTPLVSDTFSRTVANAFGTADVGGAWSVAGGTANFSVGGGTGKIKLAGAGSGPSATLASVASVDVDATIDVSIDKAATGGGTLISLAARKVGNSEYRTTAKFVAGGGVQLGVIKIVNGVSTTLRLVTVAGLTYLPGDSLTIRFQVAGTTTVSLNAKVWKTGTSEPLAWQSSATDSSATLATAGSLTLYPYLSGSATNSPVVVSFDNLTVFATKP